MELERKRPHAEFRLCTEAPQQAWPRSPLPTSCPAGVWLS